MNISDDRIEELREIWAKECGYYLSFDEMKMKAEELVGLYLLLCRKLPSDGGCASAGMPDDL